MGLMHRHTTHNKCYSSFTDFSSAMLHFLRDDVLRNWRCTYCDEVTDNFRIRTQRSSGSSRERGIVNSFDFLSQACWSSGRHSGMARPGGHGVRHRLSPARDRLGQR